MEAMWLMLQQGKPDNFVIATGETHSVREFMEYAFSEVGIENSLARQRYQRKRKRQSNRQSPGRSRSNVLQAH